MASPTVYMHTTIYVLMYTFGWCVVFLWLFYFIIRLNSYFLRVNSSHCVCIIFYPHTNWVENSHVLLNKNWMFSCFSTLLLIISFCIRMQITYINLLDLLTPTFMLQIIYFCTNLQIVFYCSFLSKHRLFQFQYEFMPF